MQDNKNDLIQKLKNQRLYNLDYLRGLAAFGIMCYHYLTWVKGDFMADTQLGRLGIYGVSVFYVLSGLTLYYVYFEKMKPSANDVLSFFKKRVFRIFPLLWLVTIIAILLSGKSPDITNLFLNLTGLFGFVRWDKYFSAGVWSIGNELVFYVFFPIFILLTKKSKPLMIILSMLIFGLYVYFAFVKLDPAQSLSGQWKNYINPLNQVFLFLGGFLIGLFLHNIKPKKILVYAMLLAGAAIFICFPASGDKIQLVTGFNRLIFTAGCFLVCIGFYKSDFRLPQLIHKPLSILGEASYSVYLLHPVIWILLGKISGLFNKHLPVSLKLLLAASFTIIMSYFVYQYFEKYFMKLGRKK